MTTNRSSFYIDSEGGTSDALARGFDWLEELACENPRKRHALVAHPAKSGVLKVLWPVIGDDAARALVKNGVVRLSSGVEASLLFERRHMHLWEGPVLAVYPTKRLLDMVDQLHGVTDVLVIPWRLEEVLFWIKAWEAMPLGQGESHNRDRAPV